MDIDIAGLCRFLVKAKIETYAGGKEAKILEDVSKELVFSDGDFMYRDRYFGENPFIGEEIVFHGKRCVWGMNYYGYAVSTGDFSLNDLYSFLRDALRKVSEKKPFRGPEKFCKRPFTYVNKVEGGISRFNGIEKIFFETKEVYRLLYDGGCIKNEA